ncbi:MAG: hypothetical protein DMG40_05290 [Acidobacteria bacterium]|nr:MAG: hypothetical protein DMG40_05290 [Acidobacteriota bacterium]
MDPQGRHHRSVLDALPYVPGKRLDGKPVFVLTSSHTFSGGEEFTYDLKALKRATIVGETPAAAPTLCAATASPSISGLACCLPGQSIPSRTPTGKAPGLTRTSKFPPLMR